MNTVTSAYLDGIKEGRDKLKNHPSQFDAKTEYQNSKAMVAMSSGAMKDFHKGERDFWKNQLEA